MTTHFKPANTAIQEMKPWNLEKEPQRLSLLNPGAKYAMIIVMAGDDDKLGSQVLPDLGEMGMGVVGGNEISILALADLGGDLGAGILEITPRGPIEKLSSPSIDTGDPRPIASFLTMALNSYSKETRIALGFWGHGSGVFNDLDPRENLIPEELLELPLGQPITETMFLQHYLAEPVPIKGWFTRGLLPDVSTGGVLTNRELSSALAVAFSRTGRTEPVDMIFFDTCQNGAVEVYAEMRRYCKTFVASCLSIPGLGWNYTWFLQMTRQTLPASAQDWAKLAIEAYNKTYDQDLYPMPVQLAALNSESRLLEKFGAVAHKLKELAPEDREKLMRSSTDLLHPVAHNESVDICLLVLFLKRNSDDEALAAACDEFIEAYNEALVALSAPPNDGKPYSGLSLWCPRLGDSLSVSKYYQHLRFHKETGWFDAIREMMTRERPRKKTEAPPIVVIGLMAIQSVEARAVEETIVDPPDYKEGQHIAIRIPEESKSWAGDLQEGVYQYKKLESAVFLNIDQVKIFVNLLRGLRRNDEEFSAFEALLNHDVVLDSKAAGRVVYELMKYERIVLDEFPPLIETFLMTRELAEKASKGGALLMGRETGGS